MKLWMITVVFIGCLAALAESASLGKPRRNPTKLKELFKKQMKKHSNIVEKKMKCRPTFRKVDVRDLLLKKGLFDVVAGDHFNPKTLFIPSCGDTCSHCEKSSGRQQVCVAVEQKEKTFYIRYGRRRPHKYHPHKEMVAKKCKCQPV